MKEKISAYSLIPIFGLAGILGAFGVSAHGFGGSALTPDQIAAHQQTMFQNEATLLGVGVDEVKNAWADGKSMQQLAQERGITQDQLAQRMKDAETARMKTELQVLVDKGIITAAQSDRRLQMMQTRAQNKKAHGRMGGMRGHGIFGF